MAMPQRRRDLAIGLRGAATPTSRRDRCPASDRGFKRGRVSEISRHRLVGWWAGGRNQVRSFAGGCGLFVQGWRIDSGSLGGEGQEAGVPGKSGLPMSVLVSG